MKIAPTVAFYTLGCKLNYSETSTIGRDFVNKGYAKVKLDDGADVCVINTCSVTENANKECARLVRKALAYNPETFIAIIGCYAQLKPGEIAQIPGVDLVLGANEKFNILEFINGTSKKTSAEIHSCSVDDIKDYNSSYSFGDRTRSFLKVQDGCDYPCTYCTIPMARGVSRSDTIMNAVSKANEISEKGVMEIVLTGVNVGDFGSGNDDKQETFLDLIKELDNVEGIERFRISSIEPNLLKNEIIEFVASSKKFVQHFHIPLQSGSNKILGLMKRRYRKELYKERVEKIKNLMPHCCIGVDVIVGFPGESHEDFLETYNLLNELPISYLH
ncbi:MAG: tRNA (N(6)-L-threonylcarbamoyladenosine(37)-C(2))-methylthiotransferase MtaB, partial [Bacteroidetes bacterium]